MKTTNMFAAVVLVALGLVSAAVTAEEWTEADVLGAQKVLNENQGLKLGFAGGMAVLNGAVCASELKAAGFQPAKIIVQTALCSLSGAFVGYGAASVGQDLGVNRAAKGVKQAQAERAAEARRQAQAEAEKQAREKAAFEALSPAQKAGAILNKQASKLAT